MNAMTQPARQGAAGGVAAAIAFTVLMWASAFPAIRVALASFSPSELAFLRFAIASAVLGLHWAAVRPPLPRGRDWLRIGAAGGLGISLYNLALNEGETLVDAGTASVLMSVGPVFAALLGVLLARERMTRAGAASVALSFIGVEVIAVFGSGQFVFNRGAALVLLAALCQALQFVIQKPLLLRHNALAVTSCVIWAGTLFLLPFAPSALPALAGASPSAMAALLFLAIGPAATAYMAWAYAMSHYPVSRVVPFLYLIPLVSLLVSFAWLGERPPPMTLVGGALALAGVVGVHFSARRGGPRSQD